jgi:pilus assembly protein FimV
MDEDRRTQLTRPNDTLWSVAKDSRESAAVTVQQQMLAIVRLNPDAFIAENVNGLKSGYLLQLPELFEASLLTASAALREVKRQYKSWVDEGFARKSRQSTREDARSLRIVETNDDSVRVLSSSSLASSAQAAAEQSASDTRTTLISAREQDIVGAREPESVNFPGTESAGMDRQIETAPASAGAAERATNQQTEPRIMPLSSAAATAAERTDSSDSSDSSEPLRSTEQRSQQDSERAENNQQIPVARTSKAKQGELSPGLVGVVATVLLTLALLLMVWRRRRKTEPAEAVEGAESVTASAITEPTVADFAAGSDIEHSDDDGHGSEDQEDYEEQPDHEDNDSLVDNEPSDVGAIEPDRREPLLVSPSGLPSMSGGADDDDIIETRLKLAVAFIEVGDEGGARELLQEVLEEGDEEQQTSARLLLEELDNPD